MNGGSLPSLPLRAHDLELPTLRAGRGPAVLALHGPTPIRADARFMQLMAEGAAVTAPTHPGFGEAARPDDFDSVYDLAHLYLQVIAESPELVVLVGFSFGGWIAAEVAAMAPAKLAALVLVDPLGVKLGDREERDIAHLFNSHPRDLEKRAWSDAGRRPSPCDGLGWQQHVAAMDDSDMVRMARGHDALCTYGWRPHMYNPSLKRWLARIKAPTLVVWGADDRIVAPSYGEAYAALIPGARFVQIKDAGHHPELEQPEAFVDAVRVFMDGLRAAG